MHLMQTIYLATHLVYKQVNTVNSQLEISQANYLLLTAALYAFYFLIKAVST